MEERALVLGSGAREHALARALLQSRAISEVVVAPGNGGIERDSRTRSMRTAALDASFPHAETVKLAQALEARLIVVGPEAPLCAGLTDALTGAGFATFGPSRSAAALEGSKAFLKRFASRHGIRTAPFHVADTYEDAERFIRAHGAPIVVKADGLCAGKGVVMAQTEDEALLAARAMLVERCFGTAGATVVLEDVIEGEEASIHAVTDGNQLIVLPAARDHKRIGEGDVGPNTGGMGVVCPAAGVSPELLLRVQKEILEPTARGMKAEGNIFKGVLFAGVMVTREGVPYLLEYNARFGDPECEALLSLFEGDLAEMCLATARGELREGAFQMRKRTHATVVVLAAEGYPASPRLGDVITGLDEAESTPGTSVFHAGTRMHKGALVTAGGRVFAITSVASTPEESRRRAYAAAEKISFEGKQYRRDIGMKRGE